MVSESSGPQPFSQSRTQARSYGPLGLIEQRTNDQAPVYPIADALGNTLGELGEDGKAELLPETDPWGELAGPEIQAPAGSPVDSPTSGFLGAAGRIELPSGGLTKLGARYYDSGIGAFISVDPVTGGPEEPIRRAGYLYGAGNPARFVDVDGESFGDAIAGAYNDVTAPIKSKAEAISMELGRISSDPSSSGLERFSANFYGGLSSLASCESFDETAFAIATAAFPYGRAWVAVKNGGRALQKGLPRLADEAGSFNPFAGKSGGRSESWWERASRLGKEGEDAVRAKYDIGPTKEIELAGGKMRRPDGLTDKTISEVKNVKFQSWTLQLSDYSAYAKQTGRTFYLYLKNPSAVSSSLRAAARRGDVVIRSIP